MCIWRAVTFASLSSAQTILLGKQFDFLWFFFFFFFCPKEEMMWYSDASLELFWTMQPRSRITSAVNAFNPPLYITLMMANIVQNATTNQHRPWINQIHVTNRCFSSTKLKRLMQSNERSLLHRTAPNHRRIVDDLKTFLFYELIVLFFALRRFLVAHWNYHCL